MKLNIEVQDHKVELVTKLLERIPFVKIQASDPPRLSDRKTPTQSRLPSYRNKHSLKRTTAD